MANSDFSSAPPIPLAPRKENVTPLNSKLAELSESRAELLNRLQSLKQDLQNWRSRVDTQVKVYHSELSELKKSLNIEVEQLRSDFQELRNTLQQQQEDVTASLKSLGLRDCSVGGPKEVAGGQDQNVEAENGELQSSTEEEQTNKKAQE